MCRYFLGWGCEVFHRKRFYICKNVFKMNGCNDIPVSVIKICIVQVGVFSHFSTFIPMYSVYVHCKNSLTHFLQIPE